MREWTIFGKVYLVCMSEADPVARMKDGGEVEGHLALTELGYVAQPRQLVVQRHVLQLLQGHREHPGHPGEGREPLLCQGIQETLDKARVVQAVNPYRAAHVVRVVTKFTISAHRGPSGQAVFDVSTSKSETEHFFARFSRRPWSPMVTELPQRLNGEALAAGALVHVAQLAGAHLAFLLAGAHPDKHPTVEVNTQAQQGLNVPPVPEYE